MKKPIGPENSGVSPQGLPHEHHQDASEPAQTGIRPYHANPKLPKAEQPTFGSELHQRNAVVANQPMPPEVGKYINEFSLNGSATALVSLLNSPQGLGGQFEIVFQPNDGGPAIPFNQFGQHPEVMKSYQDITQTIATNHQSITYGLMQNMAAIQQKMAEIAVQQTQQGHVLNQLLLQAVTRPFIQPTPVDLGYLLSFKDAQLPQAQGQVVNGWGGVPGALPPQPAWMPYPSYIPSSPPGALLAPPNSLLNTSGFQAAPVLPQQTTNLGYYFPFSPISNFIQSQAGGTGPNDSHHVFSQFAKAPTSSLLPPWSYRTAGVGVPPIIINNKNELHPPTSEVIGRENVDGHSGTHSSAIGKDEPVRNKVPSENSNDKLAGVQRGILNRLNRIKDELDDIGDKPVDSERTSQLKEEVKRLNSVLDRFPKDYQAWDGSTHTLKKMLAILSDRINDLIRRIPVANYHQPSFQPNEVNTSEGVIGLDKQNDNTEEPVINLQKFDRLFKLAENQLDSLADSIGAIKKQANQLIDELELKLRQVSNKPSDYSGVEAGLYKAQADLNDIKQRLHSVELMRDTYKNQLNSLRSQLHKALQNKQGLGDVNQQLDQFIEQLQKELRSAKSQINLLNQALSETKSQINASQNLSSVTPEEQDYQSQNETEPSRFFNSEKPQGRAPVEGLLSDDAEGLPKGVEISPSQDHIPTDATTKTVEQTDDPLGDAGSQEKKPQVIDEKVALSNSPEPRLFEPVTTANNDSLHPFRLESGQVFRERVRKQTDKNQLLEIELSDVFANNDLENDFGGLINKLRKSQQAVYSAWNTASEEMKVAEVYHAGKLGEAFPSSNLLQLDKKKRAIATFTATYFAEKNNITRNLELYQKRGSSPAVNEIGKKVVEYFQQMSALSDMHKERFDFISDKIYQDCYVEPSTGDRFYQPRLTKEVAQSVGEADNELPVERRAVSEAYDRLERLVSQNDVADSQVELEKIIAVSFTSPELNAWKTWSQVKDRVILPVCSTSGQLDIDDLHPHIRGYQTARAVQELCLAIRAHIKKFAKNDMAPGMLQGLRKEYEQLVGYMNPNIWNDNDFQNTRSDRLSDDAKQYIKKCRDESLAEINHAFGGLIGSQKARKSLDDRRYKLFRKNLSSSPLTKNCIERVKHLLRENPLLAERWFEKSMALAKMAKEFKDDNAYYAASQREVATLLQEFDIAEQIPVAAFLVATMEDISLANSTLLPYLQTYYAKAVTQDGRAKEDKYAEKIEILVDKEQQGDKKVFFRGMTLDRHDDPVEHGHTDLLINPTVTIRGPVPKKEDEYSEVQVKNDLLNPLGSFVKAERYHATGDIYGIPESFKKQGLVLKTNGNGRPVKILDLRGETWKVSPAILLNNPNLNVPFFDKKNIEKEQRYGFIPVSNTERSTGSESEGVLLVDGESCYLFTLTDTKNWVCRPFGKNLTPLESSKQKYIGYTHLALAHASQKPLDSEALSLAIQQAYKAWSYIKGDDASVSSFKAEIKKEFEFRVKGAKWLSTGNETKALALCQEAAQKFNAKPIDKVDASSPSEVRHCSIDPLISKRQPQPHPAITGLIKKLGGYDKSGLPKQSSAFTKVASREKADYFNQATLSYSFGVCDKEFLRQLEKDMPSAKGLFNHMENSREVFSREFLVDIEAYDQGMINPLKTSSHLSSNAEAVERNIKQLSVQESYLAGAGTRMNERLKKLIGKSTSNLKDVNAARKLWIKGIVPDSLKDDDRWEYLELMSQLTQVTWATNRLAHHIGLLKDHKRAVNDLQNGFADLTDSAFEQQACQLNVRFAAIYAGISEMRDFLDDQNIAKRSSEMVRSLYGFMENRNIQLRKHQMQVVPDLMRQQSEAILQDQPKNLFMMEGTGGGKSLCLEAMVDNSLNSLAQKDLRTQKRRSVLVIAPDINARQLNQSIGLSEQKNDRLLQNMDLVLTHRLKPREGKKSVFTDPLCLKKIYKTLLGLDQSTEDENVDTDLQSRRSACLLSFSAMQKILHGTEAALKLQGLDLPTKTLLNSIQDIFRESIIFGDECVSAALPYDQRDEKQLLKAVKSAVKGLDGAQVTEESIGKNAVGIMANAFVFTGLSATKGTAAIGALFAGQGSYQATADALNENLTTTRLRAAYRLAKSRIIRTKADRQVAADSLVDKLKKDQGVTILDTQAFESSSDEEKQKAFHAQLAGSWQKSLQEARTKQHLKEGEKGEPYAFSTGYIGSDGKTMLYDPHRPLYKGRLHSKLGEVITPSDETALRDSGAMRHDNVLSLDQGVGSDPVQGKSTAFVITGVFGATKHGRSDLIEQWAGRGTRASSEPYHSQDMYLTVTDEDIEKIEEKLDHVNSQFGFGRLADKWLLLKKRLEMFKESKANVEHAETDLNDTQKLPANWQTITEGYRHKVLDIDYDDRASEKDIIASITQKSKQAAKSFKEAIILSDAELGKTTESALVEGLAKKIESYLINEEVFQLNARLLLFSEMATRDRTRYTVQHESSAFEGAQESAERKMYADQAYWANEQAADFDKSYMMRIKGIVNEGFSGGASQGALDQSWDIDETEIVETLNQENGTSKITNKDDRAYLGQLKHDMMLNMHRMNVCLENDNYLKSTEEIDALAKEHVENYYRMDRNRQDQYFQSCLQTAETDHFSNRIPEGGAVSKLYRQSLKMFEAKAEEYHTLIGGIPDYDTNYEHKEDVAFRLGALFKSALETANRKKELAEGKAPLANKVKNSGFSQQVEANLSHAVDDANRMFDTVNKAVIDDYQNKVANFRQEAEQRIQTVAQSISGIQAQCKAGQKVFVSKSLSNSRDEYNRVMQPLQEKMRSLGVELNKLQSQQKRASVSDSAQQIAEDITGLKLQVAETKKEVNRINDLFKDSRSLQKSMDKVQTFCTEALRKVRTGDENDVMELLSQLNDVVYDFVNAGYLSIDGMGSRATTDAKAMKPGTLIARELYTLLQGEPVPDKGLPVGWRVAGIKVVRRQQENCLQAITDRSFFALEYSKELMKTNKLAVAARAEYDNVKRVDKQLRENLSTCAKDIANELYQSYKRQEDALMKIAEDKEALMLQQQKMKQPSLARGEL